MACAVPQHPPTIKRRLAPPNKTLAMRLCQCRQACTQPRKHRTTQDHRLLSSYPKGLSVLSSTVPRAHG